MTINTLLFASLLSAAAPGPQELSTTRETTNLSKHKGTHFKVSLGYGVGETESDLDDAQVGVRSTVTLELGTMLSKHWALGLRYGTSALTSHIDDGKQRNILSQGFLGPVLSYYGDKDWYAAASLGVIRADRGTELSGRLRDGIESQLEIGKEFWLRDNWNFALSVRSSYSNIERVTPGGRTTRLEQSGLAFVLSTMFE